MLEVTLRYAGITAMEINTTKPQSKIFQFLNYFSEIMRLLSHKKILLKLKCVP